MNDPETIRRVVLLGGDGEPDGEFYLTEAEAGALVLSAERCGMTVEEILAMLVSVGLESFHAGEAHFWAQFDARLSARLSAQERAAARERGPS